MRESWKRFTVMFKRKSAVRARTCAGVSKPGMELDCYRKLEAILQTSSVVRLEGSNPSPSATSSHYMVTLEEELIVIFWKRRRH